VDTESYSTNSTDLREQAWLNTLVSDVCKNYFTDAKTDGKLEVIFGRRARTRLGSINKDNNTGLVTIRLTGLFRDPEVPEMVVKATLVHELCHYVHGFHSDLEQRYRHPHAGGVILKEFTERGLQDLYVEQKMWLKKHWAEVVKRHYPETRVKKESVRRRGKSRLLFGINIIR
jgi:hypothetical protein